MELLRQPPFPLTLTIPDGLADHEYDVVIANEQTDFAVTLTSDALGVLTY